MSWHALLLFVVDVLNVVMTFVGCMMWGWFRQ